MTHFRNRLIFACIGAIIFSIVGFNLPYIYLRYFDTKDYIQYVGEVSFNKKVYQPCEDQVAQTSVKILIDSNIQVNSRMYLTVSSEENIFKIIKEYHFETFLEFQRHIQTFHSTVQLPCDLVPGVYFYRGILTYKIKGVEKMTSFTSEPFTVERTDKSE